MSVVRAAASLGLAALSLASGAGRASAQDAPHRIPRRLLSTAIGAGIGASLSLITRAGSGGNGVCSSGGCVTTVSTAAGAGIGYLVGSQQDRLNTLRYRGGQPLALRLTSATIRGEGVALAASDSLVAVGGSAGAELFRSGPGELRASGVRGATLRGIAAVALAPDGAVAVGTIGGAYLYPPGTAPGALVLEQEVTAALSAAGRMYLATGGRIAVAPGAADSVGSWPSVDVGVAVRGLAFDPVRSVLWAGTDSGIVAFAARGDSLVRAGAVRTGAGVRRVSLYENRLAAALGDSGVRLFDIADAAAPRLVAGWTGERFAYDVSLVGGRLFVASGLDGVTVLDATGSALRVRGIARDAGFAVALASRAGYTYVLDRSRNAVRRFDSSSQIP